MASERVRPLGPRLLIKPFADDDMTETGIVIPNRDSGDIGRGIVIAAGPGYRRFDSADLDEVQHARMEVGVGEIVVWERERGVEIEVGGETLVLLIEGHVQAVIEEADVPAPLRT